MKIDKEHRAAISFIRILCFIVVLYCVFMLSFLAFHYLPILFNDLTRKENYLVEGKYQIKEQGLDYYLELQSIAEETFLKLDGKNTVQDTSKNKKSEFYLVELYSINKEQEIINYTFMNLKDVRQKGAPRAYYRDDNGKK